MIGNSKNFSIIYINKYVENSRKIGYDKYIKIGENKNKNENKN